MAKYYSSDEEAPIVETPVADGEGEVIAATSTTEPDLPPTGPIEPIADVESTREPDADPTVPEQRFRFRQEEGEVVEAPAAPAEAPAAPMDAPAEVPAADAAPAAAPAVAPEAAPVAAPAEAPVADVPAAAPMVPPQPEAEVAPMAPAEGEAPAAAPVAPEVEAPNAPVEEPVSDAPAQCGKGGRKGFKQEDGEAISVVATPDPELPQTSESETCPETGDEYVTKDVNEPINPVVAPNQLDEGAAEEDPALAKGDEAGGTEPTETAKTDDVTIIDPEFAEEQEAAEAEVEQMFRMGYRMEDEAEVSTDSEGGQDVDINVQVRKDDGDAHEADETEVEEAPEQRFRQEDENSGQEIETVADITSAPEAAPIPDDVVDDVVPTPDPNLGNGESAEECFQQMFSAGGGWM